MIEIIEKYFPQIDSTQRLQFEKLPELYAEWNAKINVISRRDINNIMLHHVLHSLAVAKVMNFAAGTTILDVGTGGGFPGIPLAILFPEVKFHLIDSIGKKIMVASEVSKAINLKNVILSHRNVMEEEERYNFIVTRAVMSAPQLVRMTYKNVATSSNGDFDNGIIALKGGDITQEFDDVHKILRCGFGKKRHASNKKVHIWRISDFFDEIYFDEKFVVHIPL